MISTKDNGNVQSGAPDKSHFSGHYDSVGEDILTVREWVFARLS